MIDLQKVTGADMDELIIESRNLCFSYEDNEKILNNVDLTIRRGERVGIIGSNGVGKSTFMRLLVGLENGYEGTLIVCGMEADKKNIGNIRKKTGYVFQDADSQLFMPDVYSDIAFAPRNYGFSEEKVHDTVDTLIKKLGIEHLKNKSTTKLSGGEKKMVSIATVLSYSPELILLDEPTIALDPGNRRIIINTLNDLEMTRLIATHDLDMVLDTCNRVILFKNGSIAADGLPSQILTNEELLLAAGLELPLRYQH